MARASVVFEGAEELERKMRLMAARTAGRTLEQAAHAGAHVIAEQASADAPRATGFLAENIKAETHEVRGGRAQVDIGPTKAAWYGIFPEIGTKHKAARPFLRPALDTRRDDATAAVGRAIRDVLRRLTF